jgi:lipoprotein-releasing system permease protein
MRFEATMAARHLTHGGIQTWLTVAAVATGVTVIVFISSFTFGIRDWAEGLISDMLPDVTVEAANPAVRPVTEKGRKVLTESEPVNQRSLVITDWQRAESIIRRLPGIVQVTPAVLDHGFAVRGNKTFDLTVYGADPVKLDGVTAVNKYIVQGHYFGLRVDECVVDYKLVSELGIRLGDHIRLASPTGASEPFRIAGLYDSGAQRGIYKAFVTLHAAQALYDTGAAVRSLLIRTSSIWGASSAADRIDAILPYDARAWTNDFPQAASQFRIYDAVAYLVSTFSLIASSFAIASILVVQVLQKGRQIGILKSIGARSGQIFRIFVLEGLGVSVFGSALGALLGWGLVTWLSSFKLPQTSAGAVTYQMFPAVLTPGIVAAAISGAVVSTVIAAVLPARRAAGLDPIQAMR